METYRKDPNAVLDYEVGWGDKGWLELGETIVSSTWLTDPGLAVQSSEINGGVTVAWLSGGVKGRDYRVTNHITTSEGREDERSFLVQVRER